MSRVILLDSGPMGYALTPAVNETHLRCSQWLEALILKPEQIALAEIVDYECRRGWIRHDNTAALASLDRAKATLRYIPISTTAMIKAAEFWAASRKGGYSTTDDRRLDADVILAAQGSVLASAGHEVVVATMNPKHLSRFIAAEERDKITCGSASANRSAGSWPDA